ncbi:MAG: MFS transporter [Candidatus Aminicenantes bacterium]|nr:MFS transporter [Candidatus Aminicenantes bacterium]
MATIWNRRFIIALFGYLFLFMSMTLYFLFPLYLEQLSAQRGRIGLIMGIHSLTAIFVRPFFGRLIDLRGRKKISLAGIGFLILVIPFFHFIKDAGALPVLLRALTGVGWGISMTATLTICSDLAPVERLARSMGIIGVAGLLSVACGPILAEIIILRWGFHVLFNTSLAFLAAAFFLILFTPETVRLWSRPEKGKESLFHIRKISLGVLFFIGIMPVAHGSIRGAVVYFIALFSQSLGIQRIGPFFLLFSGAAILTRFGLGGLSDRYGRKRIILPAACLIGMNLVLISQLRSFWLLCLAGFIGGFGQGLIFPALSTYIIDVFGKKHKGLAIGLYLTLFDIGMGLGSAFFGWISDLYGYKNMYLLCAGLLMTAAVLFTWKAPPASAGD